MSWAKCSACSDGHGIMGKSQVHKSWAWCMCGWARCCGFGSGPHAMSWANCSAHVDGHFVIGAGQVHTQCCGPSALLVRMGMVSWARVLQRLLQVVQQGVSGLSGAEVAACLQAMASLQVVQQETSANKALQKARKQARKSAGSSKQNNATKMNSLSNRGNGVGTKKVHISSVVGVPIQSWAHVQATLARRFMNLLPEPPAKAPTSAPARATAPSPAAGAADSRASAAAPYSAAGAAYSTANVAAPSPAAAAPSPANATAPSPASATAPSPGACVPSPAAVAPLPAPASAVAPSAAAAARYPAAGAAYSAASAAGASKQRGSVPDAPPGVTGKAFTQALCALWSMGVGLHASTDLERVLHCAHKLAQQRGALDRRSIVTLAKLIPDLARRQAQQRQQQEEQQQLQTSRHGPNLAARDQPQPHPHHSHHQHNLERSSPDRQQQQQLALVQTSPKAVLKSLLVSSMSMGLRPRHPSQPDPSASLLFHLQTSLTSSAAATPAPPSSPAGMNRGSCPAAALPFTLAPSEDLGRGAAAAANPTTPASPPGTEAGRGSPAAAIPFALASSADLGRRTAAAAAPLFLNAQFATATAAGPNSFAHAPLGHAAAAAPFFSNAPFGPTTAAAPHLLAHGPFGTASAAGPNSVTHVPANVQRESTSDGWHVQDVVALLQCALQLGLKPPRAWLKAVQQKVTAVVALPVGALSEYMPVLEVHPPHQQQQQQQQQHMHGGQAHQLHQGRQQFQQQQHMHGKQAHQLHQGRQQFQQQQQQQQQHTHGGQVYQVHQGRQQYEARQQQQQEVHGQEVHQLHQGYQLYQDQQYQNHQHQQQQQQQQHRESAQQLLAQVCHKRALELMCSAHPQTLVKGSLSSSSLNSSSLNSSSSSPSQRQQPTLTPDNAALLLHQVSAVMPEAPEMPCHRSLTS
ncbi:hypothetical protein DUNSADRAFT_3171 [Dunaliella salina]|uniref:Uncharacterized protein n=1 Tax=Dunaliella salina TaxID=3046 RepID=A0ABQ7GUG8_DUNSA|nr:hypothetical protein DUNSADRAFT_3171 [Dunaliella salina]|eukprot:KAF5838256.1 hypothetical protein DUNSADRAFT_3171 [Dunaliella salina]